MHKAQSQQPFPHTRPWSVFPMTHDSRVFANSVAASLKARNGLLGMPASGTELHSAGNCDRANMRRHMKRLGMVDVCSVLLYIAGSTHLLMFSEHESGDSSNQ